MLRSRSIHAIIYQSAEEFPPPFRVPQTARAPGSALRAVGHRLRTAPIRSLGLWRAAQQREGLLLAVSQLVFFDRKDLSILHLYIRHDAHTAAFVAKLDVVN